MFPLDNDNEFRLTAGSYCLSPETNRYFSTLITKQTLYTSTYVYFTHREAKLTELRPHTVHCYLMAPGRCCSPVAPLSPHSSEPAHKYYLHDVIATISLILSIYFLSIINPSPILHHYLNTEAHLQTEKRHDNGWMLSSPTHQKWPWTQHPLRFPCKIWSIGTVFTSVFHQSLFETTSLTVQQQQLQCSRTTAHMRGDAVQGGGGWTWKGWEHPLTVTYDVKGISTHIFLQIWQ